MNESSLTPASHISDHSHPNFLLSEACLLLIKVYDTRDCGPVNAQVS